MFTIAFIHDISQPSQQLRIRSTWNNDWGICVVFSPPILFLHFLLNPSTNFIEVCRSIEWFFSTVSIEQLSIIGFKGTFENFLPITCDSELCKTTLNLLPDNTFTCLSKTALSAKLFLDFSCRKQSLERDLCCEKHCQFKLNYFYANFINCPLLQIVYLLSYILL